MLTGYIKPGNASKQEAMYTKEDESEKAATISTGTRSVVTLPEAENCEPVYSPPLNYLHNCKPPVPRAFNSQRKLSFTAIGRFVALHIRAEAVCTGDGLSLYNFSAWNSHAIITI